jgi:hypothetical protein
MAASWLMLAAALLALAGGVSGLHFMVREGIERCFIEEVPSDMLVLGKYKNPDAGSGPGKPDIKMVVTVRDPKAAFILTHTCVENEGRFAFTSTQGGEHLVCVKTQSASFANRELRFSLELETGEGATDYEELAKMEHLSAIEVEVRKLNDKVHSVRAEQQYQRKREEEFRATSENTNAKVVWLSILQAFVLVFSAFLQLRKLKNFFKAKKLA